MNAYKIKKREKEICEQCALEIFCKKTNKRDASFITRCVNTSKTIRKETPDSYSSFDYTPILEKRKLRF